MRGGRLHHILSSSSGAQFSGLATIRAELYRPQGENYPAAIATRDPNRFVFGELYTLRDSDALLERLDIVEGCDDGLYVRSRVDAFQEGKARTAWVYLYAKSIANAEPIPDGHFRIDPAAT
jgi:gamma-glutamylcyclotransferase (GGCT)/AIG2-like uncharacterized protein YtfP